MGECTTKSRWGGKQKEDIENMDENARGKSDRKKVFEN